MGLVFEEDKAKGQVVIADFVEGSEAEQRSKVSTSHHTLTAVPAVPMLTSHAESKRTKACFCAACIS